MPRTPGSPIAELLRSRRTAILSTWEARARTAHREPVLPAAHILDSVMEPARAASLSLDVDGAAPERIVEESQLLRRIVHEVNAAEPRPLSKEQLDRVDDAIDDTIIEVFARLCHDLDELRSTDARLRAMFDHSPTAMWIKDTKGRYVMINRKCATLLGGTPDTLEGECEQDVVPREVAAIHLANDRRVLEDGGPLEIEEWLPSGGETRSFLSIKFVAPAPDRDPLVCGIATDITDQKRSEAGQHLLAEAGRLLAQSLDYEDTLAQVVRLAIPEFAAACCVDVLEGGKFHRVAFVEDDSKTAALADFVAGVAQSLDSPQAVPVAIRSGSTLLFPSLDDAAFDKFQTKESVRRALRAFEIDSALIVPLLGRNGPIGALSLGASHRRYGESDRAIGESLGHIVADAIEQARLYREARELAGHLEDVLAIVSHDLRSPLAAVQAASSMLERRTGDELSLKQLGVVRRATARMDRLIKDLLQAAALRSGHLVVSRRPEHLRPILAEAVDMHVAVARPKGIRVKRAFDGDDPSVSCDRDRIVQVLSNLLGNALKFCRKGDTITVGEQTDNGEVRVFVEDTGPGIAASDCAHLFDRYWSARAHTGKGTGLGLFISKGLVEAHGGRMGVESAPGRGSTFWFTLPRT